MAREVGALSPREFCERWPDANRGDVQLLDVREPQELAMASITACIAIPMRQIPDRLAELDPDRPIVVMCHTGIRSRHVAAFLIANGYEQVFNLDGGIDAWSTDIDPNIPRY
jgi:rhodanese-related sulfurtransferase